MSRTVLVTGGTDGIGRELVRALAARGDDVIATGRRVGGADFAPEPGVRYLRVDQAEPAEAARLIAAEAGDIDVAILNAGTGTLAAQGIEGADAIRRTLRVNLTATVLIAHALAPVLLGRGGTLCLIGSTARRGAAALPTYAASKGGLHGFARALGEEWRGRASVVMLHPGPTRTDMQRKAGLDVGGMARWFVPAPLAARTILARVDGAHGRHRPVIANAAHGAAARRWLAERMGA